MLAIPALLTLLGQLVPSLATSTAIQTVISGLVQAVPVIVKEAQDVTPMIKNIIAALKDNPAATSDQLAALKVLDAQCDADFEDAAIPQPGDPDYVPPTA